MRDSLIRPADHVIHACIREPSHRRIKLIVIQRCPIVVLAYFVPRRKTFQKLLGIRSCFIERLHVLLKHRPAQLNKSAELLRHFGNLRKVKVFSAILAGYERPARLWTYTQRARNDHIEAHLCFDISIYLSSVLLHESLVTCTFEKRPAMAGNPLVDAVKIWVDLVII